MTSPNGRVSAAAPGSAIPRVGEGPRGFPVSVGGRYDLRAEVFRRVSGRAAGRPRVGLVLLPLCGAGLALSACAFAPRHVALTAPGRQAPLAERLAACEKLWYVHGTIQPDGGIDGAELLLDMGLPRR
jgi:hypothetical protein